MLNRRQIIAGTVGYAIPGLVHVAAAAAALSERLCIVLLPQLSSRR